ncbi:putative dsRNA-binding protein [Cyanobium sp. FGCU-6]|jgi:ribonuclease-3|nr:putative dsRNA-binding protein [Cyanobium sp. FGCU6]
MDNARRLQLRALLQQLGLDSPSVMEPIDEALTHTSAGLARNHERLEFLGDAVLRLAAAEFLEREHPQLSVGQRSSLRAQLVSDRWLAELADTCGLEPALRIGAIAGGDRAGRATVRAECAEALVGGLYEAWGGGTNGLAAIHRWLTPHWRLAAADQLADPHRHNWKTALQEWSQGQGLGLPAYRCEERSRSHGDPRRFHCRVAAGPLAGEGWGGSRREAEQQAARSALKLLRPPAGC